MKNKAQLPKIGDIVDVSTTRFGRATVKIINVGEEWIDTEIVKGWLRGMTEDWGPGDKKTLRIEHCTFYETAK